MIRLEVFDFDMNRLGIINKYTLIQYTDKFSGVGSFSLDCPVTQENIELLKKDRILWIEEGIAGVIQYIDKSQDNESKLSIKGNLIGVILDWRYVYPTYTKTASPIKHMENLVTLHCISPSDTKRKLPFLAISSNNTSMNSVTYQKTGGSVNEALLGLAESNGLGYRVSFNPRLESPIQFRVLNSVDHTQRNGVNPPVVFSYSLDNIIKGDYTYNDDDYRNVALVAGEAVDKSQQESETAPRTTKEVVLEETSGFARKELFVDARDLQSEYYDGEEEKTMSPQEYLNSLVQRGNEKLSECKVEESYSCQLRTDSNTLFKYREDYNLGDKVTVFDKELGIAIDVTVTEMEVSYDKDGYTYTPTFGYGLPTLLTKAKRMI